MDHTQYHKLVLGASCDQRFDNCMLHGFLAHLSAIKNRNFRVDGVISLADRAGISHHLNVSNSSDVDDD